MTEHKKLCLKINGEQAVKLEKETIEFENYCKQIPIPFKVYVDFESILIGVESNAGSCTKKYQDYILWSFSYKLVCADNKFSKPIILYRGGIAAYKLIKAILEEYEYFKKVMKKYFNKNLIMTEKEEENYRSSNTCWVCEKFIEDEKVRDHYHITGKYRSAAHWKCNVNLKLTKNVPAIFHNLKGYNSHLIINQIGKFDVKVDVISNGLEKYIAFTINKNLIFTESMQLMNSSLEKLFKNLLDNDFKCETQEFGSENVMLLKQKDDYHYEYMNSFERFSKKYYLIKNIFTGL